MREVLASPFSSSHFSSFFLIMRLRIRIRVFLVYLEIRQYNMLIFDSVGWTVIFIRQGFAETTVYAEFIADTYCSLPP